MCQPKEICSLKLSLNKPVPPGREKFLTDVERIDLQEMYKVLYGDENVKHVPLRYTQLHQVRVFEQIYTSMKSRTCRSSVVIAVWSHLTSILTTQPTMEDVRVGVIEYFLLHVPEIKINTSEEVSKQDHILVHIIWYQDHPQKLLMGNGIVLSATVAEHSTCSSFMPVSRIISRCPTVCKVIQLDHMKDKVCISIPVRRHYLFFKTYFYSIFFFLILLILFTTNIY